jgi:ribosomal protein S18 acetylase RimI-like enzyme
MSKINSDQFIDTFSPLVSNNDASFNDFLRIYKESMPAREQKSAAQISAMLTRDDYQILLLKRNDLAVGFSIVFVPPKESFCLLEYFAVDAAYRNSGLGRQLFLRSADYTFSKAGSVPLLLEVDSDREPSADRLIRRRRQQFYRRLNCLRIDKLPYFLPLPGKGPPPQIDLMVYFLGSVQVIGKAQLQHWLKRIYHDVYDCSEDDPRIMTMLESVTDPVEIV